MVLPIHRGHVLLAGLHGAAGRGRDDTRQPEGGQSERQQRYQYQANKLHAGILHYRDTHSFDTGRLCYKSMRLRRMALLITDTELKLMAAAAIIGDSSRPKKGYSTPAAIGTPSTL